MSNSKYEWSWKGKYPVVDENKILKDLKQFKNLSSIKDSNGDRLIHFAAENNLTRVFKWLVKKDSTLLNKKRKDGKTPQQIPHEVTIEDLRKILPISDTQDFATHKKIGKDSFELEYDKKNRQLTICFTPKQDNTIYMIPITKNEEKDVERITAHFKYYNKHEPTQNLILLLNEKRISYENKIPIKTKLQNTEETTSNQLGDEKNKNHDTVEIKKDQDEDETNFKPLSSKNDIEGLGSNMEWIENIKKKSDEKTTKSIEKIKEILKKFEDELLKNPIFSKRTIDKYNALGNALQNYLNTPNTGKDISEHPDIKNALQMRRFGWYGQSEKTSI